MAKSGEVGKSEGERGGAVRSVMRQGKALKAGSSLIFGEKPKNR